MFTIPDDLIALGKKRMEGHTVQGFVRSYGNPHPKLLLVGEGGMAVMALSLLLIA